jgi:flavodoxin I
MRTTALIYSPEGGNVNSVTDMLGELIGMDKVDIIPVKDVEEGDLNDYDQLIILGSTVGTDHWSNETIIDEWPGFYNKIKDIPFENKKVAIVGLGNSFLYPSHFADGMAMHYEKLTKLNARVLGKVEAEGYDFTDSESLDEDGYFCGLAIDEDNEPELTRERLENWLSILKPDFEF